MNVILEIAFVFDVTLVKIRWKTEVFFELLLFETGEFDAQYIFFSFFLISKDKLISHWLIYLSPNGVFVWKITMKKYVFITWTKWHVPNVQNSSYLFIDKNSILYVPIFLPREIWNAEIVRVSLLERLLIKTFCLQFLFLFIHHHNRLLVYVLRAIHKWRQQWWSR